MNKIIEIHSGREQLKPRANALAKLIMSIVVALAFAGIVFLVTWHDITNGHVVAIGTVAFISILLPTPIIILSTIYLYEDLSKKVFIDREKGLLIIQKRKKETIITKADIADSYHIKARRQGRRSFILHDIGYEYVLLVLNERKRIFITYLLCDPKEIVSLFLLPCTKTKVAIPLLDRGLGSGVLTSEEYEQKVGEFELRFKNFPDEKLHTIVRNRKEYAPTAIEAAKKILEKRKQANEFVDIN